MFVDYRCSTKLSESVASCELPEKESTFTFPTQSLSEKDHLKHVVKNQNASPHYELTRTLRTAWTENFRTRNRTERVRNCQNVSQGTKDHVVQTVFEAVLQADNARIATGHDGRCWRMGGNSGDLEADGHQTPLF